jgi:XapX domain-containing protein
MSLRRARGSAEAKHSVLHRPRTLTLFWRRCADRPRETPKPSLKKGMQMIGFLVSGAVGLLVGLIYGLLSVKSPAPPLIALIGLLAILVGEQIPLFFRHMWGG